MTCRHTSMAPGIALQQTTVSDGGDVRSVSPGGPGRLIPCLKCKACGYSEVFSDNCYFLESGERDALLLSQKSEPAIIAPLKFESNE